MTTVIVDVENKMQIRHLFNWIFPKYTEFEESFFSEMKRVLGKRNGDILQSQIREINYVQRHRGDEEICFYKISGLSVDMSRRSKFESRGEERLCRFKGFADGVTFEVDVWVVDGNLFSLEFDREMRKSRKSAVLWLEKVAE